MKEEIKIFKKILIFLSIFAILISNMVFAKERTIVTLGADLKPVQKENILNELNAPNDAKIIEVTNSEEYKYLGDIIPKKDIGNVAISSAIITFKDDSGINIKLSPVIKTITKESYRNALITAGVENADVYITAPTNVSGTAALTGIFKSYENFSGKKISEDVKKVANREMIVQSDLSKDIGDDKANDFITKTKLLVGDKLPKNDSDMNLLIDRAAKELNINLTDSQRESVLKLFNEMKNSNIDWNKVKDEAFKYSKKAKDYINSEEGQKNIKKAKGLIQRFLDWIFSLLEKK